MKQRWNALRSFTTAARDRAGRGRGAGVLPAPGPTPAARAAPPGPLFPLSQYARDDLLKRGNTKYGCPYGAKFAVRAFFPSFLSPAE